jgi:hypothetical protein
MSLTFKVLLLILAVLNLPYVIGIPLGVICLIWYAWPRFGKNAARPPEGAQTGPGDEKVSQGDCGSAGASTNFHGPV